jgi:hypothetical protein
MENIIDVGAQIDGLQPVTYEQDGRSRVGVIAREGAGLEGIVGVGALCKGGDFNELVLVLLAEIKSLRARVAALETE